MISEILTAKIVAEIAWKAIKAGATMTKEFLRPQLKSWILTDAELDILSNTINSASPAEKKTQIYLEAYIDDKPEIQDIINNARPVETYAINATNNFQSPIAGKIDKQENHYHGASPTPEKKNT